MWKICLSMLGDIVEFNGLEENLMQGMFINIFLWVVKLIKKDWKFKDCYDQFNDFIKILNKILESLPWLSIKVFLFSVFAD